LKKWTEPGLNRRHTAFQAIDDPEKLLSVIIICQIIINPQILCGQWFASIFSKNFKCKKPFEKNFDYWSEQANE